MSLTTGPPGLLNLPFLQNKEQPVHIFQGNFARRTAIKAAEFFLMHRMTSGWDF